MQVLQYEGDLCAVRAPSATAPWILEGPDRVDIYNGRLRIYAEDKLIAITSMPHDLKDCTLDELRVRIIHTPRLYLSRYAALAMMRGRNVADLLGKAAAMYKFRVVKPWDPRPGFTNVGLVIPFENPEGLESREFLMRYVLSSTKNKEDSGKF
jgi:hypothetical protein